MNLRTFRNWALLALIFGLFGFNNTDARADVAPLSHWNKANSALSTYTKRHFKTSPLPRPGIYLGGNYNPNTGVSVFKAQVKGVRRGTTRSHLYPLQITVRKHAGHLIAKVRQVRATTAKMSMLSSTAYYREAVRTAKRYCRATYLAGTWHQKVNRNGTNNITIDGWQFSASISGTLKSSSTWESRQVTVVVRRVNGAWSGYVM
jgi:hypothetical protein